MAARVSPAQVREVITTNLDDVTILGSQIDTANAFIAAHLLGAGHTDRTLNKIELYLAAHFVCITEERGGITFDKTGEAATSISDQFGPGLRSTRFGDHAILLDTAGILANLATPKLKAQFRVV